MNVEKLMKMAGSVRTSGKGTTRSSEVDYDATGPLFCRKKKAVHRTTTTDDKRLQSTLKRIRVNAIPAIEFKLRSLQTPGLSNCGCPQTKKLQDILPGIINQLGPDNLDNLRKLPEQFQKQAPGAAAGGDAAARDDDDDEVPELVTGETFEGAAEESHTHAHS